MGRKSREKREFRKFAAEYSERPTSRREDLVWGLGWGLMYAGACSLYVIILIALRGPDAIRDSAAASGFHFTSGQFIGLYFAVGAFAGVVAGLLRKHAQRSRQYSRGVGALVGFIVYGVFAAFIHGVTVTSLITAVVLGAPMGFFVTFRIQRQTDSFNLDVLRRQSDAIREWNNMRGDRSRSRTR